MIENIIAFLTISVKHNQYFIFLQLIIYTQVPSFHQSFWILLIYKFNLYLIFVHIRNKKKKINQYINNKTKSSDVFTVYMSNRSTWDRKALQIRKRYLAIQLLIEVIWVFWLVYWYLYNFFHLFEVAHFSDFIQTSQQCCFTKLKSDISQSLLIKITTTSSRNERKKNQIKNLKTEKTRNGEKDVSCNNLPYSSWKNVQPHHVSTSI